MSLTKKYAIIGTENGFCIVDNEKKIFERFEKENNPFSREPGTGVKLCTML